MSGLEQPGIETAGESPLVAMENTGEPHFVNPHLDNGVEETRIGVKLLLPDRSR